MILNKLTTVEIEPQDIDLLFTDPEETTVDHWIRQILEIVMFLKSTPPTLLHTLSEKELRDLSYDIEKEAKGLVIKFMTQY